METNDKNQDQANNFPKHKATTDDGSEVTNQNYGDDSLDGGGNQDGHYNRLRDVKPTDTDTTDQAGTAGTDPASILGDD